MTCAVTVTCGTTIINLPIGSDCSFGFVFKDDTDTPIDLHDAEFVFTATAKYPALMLEFNTTADPTVLYVQEDVLIQPFGELVYLADWLVLALTPDLSRQIPVGALTRWEIEWRKDGEQRNWGSGIFRGCGG